MSYKLYSPQNQITAGTKIELLCKFIELPVEVERIPWDQIKSAEYLKKHPLGKVPTLETPEGCIYESNAIMRYLARKVGKFYGNTPAETATIDQWLEFYNTQLSANHPRVLYGTLGYMPVTKEVYEAGKKDYIAVLKIVDAVLQKTPYLAGNELTIADLTLFPSIRMALRLFLDEKIRHGIPHVVQWHERLFSHKEIADFFGKPWLCSQEAHPIFEHHHKEKHKKEEPKKEEHKKEEPKKKEPKKKEEPKKKDEPKKKEEAKKKKEKEDDGDDEPAPKKKENPYDLLPKSTFNIDDWKREFFNSENRAATLQELWGKLDTEGWSVWKVAYIKYEGEGKVGFLTNNLRTGQLRNLDDGFRKYCLAAYGVYGEEGNYDIDGFWLWRGTEISHFWTQHNSFEYFTFTKLDPKSEETHKLAAEYWLNVENEGGVVLGRKAFEVEWYR